MSLTLDAADELAARLRTATDPTGLDVMVTLDTVAAEGQARAGGVAIVINPPVITCETYHAVELEFSVWIITGPPNNRLEAWQRLDRVIDALRVPGDVDRFEPAAFAPSQGPQLPAYIATLTAPYDL